MTWDDLWPSGDRWPPLLAPQPPHLLYSSCSRPSPSQRDITHGNVDRYVTYLFGPDSSVCGDVSLNAAAGEMTPLLSVFCGMPLSFRTNARETRQHTGPRPGQSGTVPFYLLINRTAIDTPHSIVTDSRCLLPRYGSSSLLRPGPRSFPSRSADHHQHLKYSYLCHIRRHVCASISVVILCRRSWHRSVWRIYKWLSRIE